jgi:ABC-type molybdate transport system substrate-binding protein
MVHLCRAGDAALGATASQDVDVFHAASLTLLLEKISSDRDDLIKERSMSRDDPAL